MIWFLNDSGFLVRMSTAPATPPSVRSAVALLRTTTWPTSSEGSMREAHAAADEAHLVEHEPVARGDGVAVDEGLREAGVGAANADAVVFVEAAGAARLGAGGDARNALQRIRDVLVGHLADVFRGDHFDQRVGRRAWLRANARARRGCPSLPPSRSAAVAAPVAPAPASPCPSARARRPMRWVFA